MQVTNAGGFAAQESLDGQYLIYGKDRVRSTLWRRRLPDGMEESALVSLDGHARRVLQFACWRPTRDGIVFLEELPETPEAGRRHALQVHDRPARIAGAMSSAQAGITRSTVSFRHSVSGTCARGTLA